MSGSIHRFFDTITARSIDFFFKNEVPHWKDADGVEYFLDNPIFGRNSDLSKFEYYQLTTSGTPWDTYVGTNPLPAGKDGTYLVFGYFMARMNTASISARARIGKNGNDVNEFMQEEFKDTNSSETVPRILVKKIDLVEGDVVDLDFATESTSGTITVKEGILVLWRIA